MMSSLTENELGQLIRKSDNSAFKELYSRLYKPLYFFIFTRLKDDELSKDLLQDVFLKFWNNRETLDPEKSIKSLLYTISNNLIIDQTRKSASSNLRLTDLNVTGDIEDKSDSESGNEDLTDRIKSIIERQPESIKAVYILSKVEGYKNAEIGQILNISVKTVEARMTKLLKELREKLISEKK